MDKEIKLIYKLVKSFQNELNVITKEQLSDTLPFIKKYNQLRRIVVRKFPDAIKYTNKLYPAGSLNPTKSINQFSAVKLETNSLVDFLGINLSKENEIINDILSILNSKLRATFREMPKDEKDVQEKVDVVLNISDFKYLREQVTIPYSTKYFTPDFTFENENVVLEIKFCNRNGKEKLIIDEINADIQAYKTKYQKIIFLVYDMGLIRDVPKFKQDIHNGEDVYIEVIKH